MAAAVQTVPLPANTQVPLDTIPISPEKENSDRNVSAVDSMANPSDETVTVFHDSENFNVKHPLMHEWTLWFTKPPSGKVSALRPAKHLCNSIKLTAILQGDNWNDLLKEVVTFDSVEEFWGIYVSWTSYGNLFRSQYSFHFALTPLRPCDRITSHRRLN